MRELEFLRARARDLRAQADLATDGAIAAKLRELAGEFDLEAALVAAADEASDPSPGS